MKVLRLDIIRILFKKRDLLTLNFFFFIVSNKVEISFDTMTRSSRRAARRARRLSSIKTNVTRETLRVTFSAEMLKIEISRSNERINEVRKSVTSRARKLFLNKSLTEQLFKTYKRCFTEVETAHESSRRGRSEGKIFTHDNLYRVSEVLSLQGTLRGA